MNKKIYIKPAAILEPLGVSGHIAPGCSMGPTFAEFDCPVMVPEWGITFFGESNCEYSPPDAYDMVCYHVPTADHNVFTS